MYNDSEIVERIRNLLEDELQELSYDIKVRCVDGHVTISGIVDTLSEKVKIEELVRRIDGIKKLENSLTISTDGTFTDKEAEFEVINKLKNNPDLNSVGVKVEGGTAILMGTVDTAKVKRQAMETAKEAFGVKDVVSNMKVKDEGKIDDITLTNKIVEELRNHGISNNDLNISVDNGYVRLSGFVNGRSEIEMAIEIIEDIEGVKKVRNLLKTRR
ncbi:MAG: BON domain-containing protein [Caloramator sp.]|nr:BON domain-containing protein [Caloramator sp.]